MRSKKAKIALVIADIRNSNLGDKAIFEALSTLLFEQGYEKVYKLSYRSFTQRDIEHIFFLNIYSVIKGIFLSDRVFLGGGGVFQDSTSKLNLPYFFITAFIGFILRKPIEVKSVGVVKLRFRLSALLVRLICLMASRVSVRDEGSRLRLANYYDGEVDIEPDLVLSFSPEIESIPIRIKNLTQKPYLVVVVRPFIHLEVEESRCTLNELMKVLDRYALEHGLKLLLPVFHPERDLALASDLKKEVESEVTILPFVTPDEFFYLAQSASLCVCMRLHASIISYIADAKFLAISYDEKVDHFMSSVQLSHLSFSSDNIGELKEYLKQEEI